MIHENSHLKPFFKKIIVFFAVLKEAVVELVPPSTLATSAAVIHHLDLETCSREDTEFSSPFKLVALRDAELTSLAGYFDCTFALEEERVVLSTAPEAEPTHWKQTVFYLREKVRVAEGQELRGNIEVARPKEDARYNLIYLYFSRRISSFTLVLFPQGTDDHHHSRGKEAGVRHGVKKKYEPEPNKKVGSGQGQALNPPQKILLPAKNGTKKHETRAKIGGAERLPTSHIARRNREAGCFPAPVFIRKLLLFFLRLQTHPSFSAFISFLAFPFLSSDSGASQTGVQQHSLGRLMHSAFLLVLIFPFQLLRVYRNLVAKRLP